MNPNALRAISLLALSAGLMFAGGASAQVNSPKVVISNTSPQAEIGLETGSNVEFAANGDLTIRCRKTGNDCVTANIGGGGVGNGPTGLVLTPSATTLTAGAPFNLTWTSTNAEACYAVGPSGVSGWSGRALATVQGSPGLSLSLVQGVYAFQMRCYNAGGSTSVTSATVTVEQGGGGPGPGTGYCSEYYDGSTRPVPTDVRFTAHGFARSETAFSTIWGTTPGIGGGPAISLPGNFLNPAALRYLTIPFVLNAPANQVTFQWIDAQGTGIPSGAVSVTISPCPGDFRPRSFNPPGNDVYLSFNCGSAQAGISGSLSASRPESGLAGCVAPTGKTMYLNIATYDMFTPTTPSSTSCGASSTCGVNMHVQ